MSAVRDPALPVDLRALVHLETPEEVVLEFELAPIGSRVAALLIDIVILTLAIVVLAMVAALALSAHQGGFMLAVFLVLFFVLRNFYFALSELRWSGRTLGKRRVGLRVIARDGGPLTPAHVFARNLTRELALFLPIQLLLTDAAWIEVDIWWLKPFAFAWLVVLVLLPFFNKHRARVGDLVAGTLVVVSPKAVLAPDLASATEAQPLTFTEAQLALYGIRELQVLEDVLRRGPDQYDADLLAAIAEKVKKKIAWPRAAWEQDPEPFLRAFYAAQRRHLEHEMLFGRRREKKVR